MILSENDGEIVVWSEVWWVSVEVSVCLSKEKRKKMKGRKEMAGQKREKGWYENGWWGIVGLGGARVFH